MLQNITAPIGAVVLGDSSKIDAPSSAPQAAAPAPGAAAGNRLGWEPAPEPEPEPEPEPAESQPRVPYPWEGVSGEGAYMALLMRKEQLKELDLANDPAALDEWMALLGALDKEANKTAVVRAAEAEAEAEKRAEQKAAEDAAKAAAEEARRKEVGVLLFFLFFFFFFAPRACGACELAPICPSLSECWMGVILVSGLTGGRRRGREVPGSGGRGGA